MEQNNEQMVMPTLKAGSNLTITITGDVYQRIVILLQSILEGKTEEEMKEAKKQIDEKLVKDLWVLNYETVFHLMILCEKFAKDNNLIENISLEEYQQMINDAMSQ